MTIRTLTGLIGVVVFALIACKKEEPYQDPTIQGSIDQSNSMSLGGQTWLVYQYAFESGPYVPMNDSIGFLTDTICMWNGIEYAYSAYSFSGHSSGKFLHFDDSPYGRLQMLYPYDLNSVGSPPDSMCCDFRAYVDTTTRHFCFVRDI